MARLVIVSNRVSSSRDRKARAGGLAVALREALDACGGLWFGWSGEIVEHAPDKPRLARSGKVTIATRGLTPEEHQSFYVGYANGMLWPLFHYRPGMFNFGRGAFAGYLGVNRCFAKQLAPLLRPDDLVWVHDYHFIPLAAELRKLGVRNRIGFFLHIPFPVPEIFVALPGHKRLMADLCAYDLIGMQTESDVRALLRYVVEEAAGKVDVDGAIACFGLRSRIGAFPIGIATAEFAAMAEKAVRADVASRLSASLGARDLIIGVDRLDYSKGLTQRLEAFHDLFARWPEHLSRVTLMQIAPISRGEVAQYRALRRELESAAGRINGQFAQFDWTPVRYLNTSFRRDVLAGFYRIARVGLVTPIRDGMNLVAKEYVAAQNSADPGVLVLSRFAGAARELSSALIVNPFDVDELSSALHRALTMPLDERRSRYHDMMEKLLHNTIGDWRDQFLAALEQSKPNDKDAPRGNGSKGAPLRDALIS